MQNLMNDLTKLFQQDDRIFAAGTLLKNKLTELALKFDQPLIDLLLSDKKAREHFFTEKAVKKEKVLVFDKDKFISFVNNKEFLPDSFTSFKNKIGLMDNGDYLKEKSDVVLAWAYKDCVLEGGQDREDQKRDEIFYNETLSPDEIDQLFEPKVLTNFKRIDGKGENKVTGFNPSDNLIIKGNNLLALHCLKQKYRGKVKLIYIDPPFNRPNSDDSFGYNDKFKHSTWLTFMKNRIEMAKELLSNNGAIVIHLDDNEVDYCKIILDEVFGRDNFINRISIDARSPSAFSTVNPGVFKSSEYLLWFAKNKNQWISKSLRIPGPIDSAYNKYVKNRQGDPKNWIFIPIKTAFIEHWNKDKIPHLKVITKDLYSKIKNFKETDIENFLSKNFNFAVNIPLKKISKNLANNLNKIKNAEFNAYAYDYLLNASSYFYSPTDLQSFILNNANAICRDTEISDIGAGKDTVELKYKSIDRPNEVLVLKRKKGLEDQYVRNGKQLVFYEKNVEEIDGKLTGTKLLTTIWSDISWEGIAKEGGVKLKKGKKPEKLIARIIELNTEVGEGEIVMDFFLGSGTTAAVAHKLGLQYIGIEQLDYENNDGVARLKNVIDGDKTGISKSVNWEGDGSFVYMELKKWNDEYMAAIQEADTTQKLLSIYKKMKKESFFRYDIDLSKFDEKEFKKLSLEEQKQVLCECLDKNHLYVNLSEISDATYKISAEDKKLNKQFYKPVF